MVGAGVGFAIANELNDDTSRRRKNINHALIGGLAFALGVVPFAEASVPTATERMVEIWKEDPSQTSYSRRTRPRLALTPASLGIGVGVGGHF